MAEKKRLEEPNEESGEEGEEGEDAAEAPPKPDVHKPESPEKTQEDEVREDAAVPDSPPALPDSPNEEEAPLSSHSKQASPQRSPGYTGPSADFPAVGRGSPAYYRGSPPAYKGSWAPHYYRFQSAAYSGAQDFASSAAATSAPMATNSSSGAVNAFANDGSFLELFKKKMEASAAGGGGSTSTTAASSSSTTGEAQGGEEAKSAEPEKRKPISFVGKRRGGAKLALKTGMVAKKPKTEEEEVLSSKGGAWAQYMAEVKKYKAHQCGDDDKTRPLVK